MANKGMASYMKDPSFVLKILGVVGTLFIGWIAMGDSMWFGKDAGEALERRQITIESDSKHRDDLIMKEQTHMRETLKDMRTEQKEDFKELKTVIIDYITAN